MPFLLQVVAEESEEEKVDDKVSRSFMELRLRVFRACGDVVDTGGRKVEMSVLEL